MNHTAYCECDACDERQQGDVIKFQKLSNGWIDGAPETLQAGMLVLLNDGRVILIGHSDPCCRFGLVNFDHIENVLKTITAHKWLIYPSELRQLEKMGIMKAV